MSEYTRGTTLEDTPEPGTRENADRAFGVVTGYIDDQPLESGLMLLSGYRNQFDALESTMLARNTKEKGASRRNNETLLGRTSKSTKRESKKRASRAAAVSENPNLGDDLANGDLGTDHHRSAEPHRARAIGGSGAVGATAADDDTHPDDGCRGATAGRASSCDDYDGARTTS